MNDVPNRTRRALLGIATGLPVGPPVALIGPACLCNTQVLCESCRDVCPSRAIRWERTYRSTPRPRVLASACTACGECVSVCPTGAISVGSAET